MAIQTITQQQISTVEFTELTNTILESMVTQTGSAFETVMDKFQAYLDNSSLSGVDEVQKAAAYAQFTKDVYSDINRQALTSAMDLLKSNAQLSYEKWKVEADYNMTIAQANKVLEEQGLIALTHSKMEKENTLLDNSLEMAKAQLLEQRAKLKKQYGVADGYEINIDFTNGKKYAYAVVDGIGSFYRANVQGQYLMNEAEVTAYNAIVPTPDPLYVYGETTTTDMAKAEKAVITSSVQVGAAVVNTVTPGAIDKQILGYDYVNYKDVLKTMDERAALMQNAKVAETCNEKMARLALIKALTVDVPGMPTTLGSTGC